MLSRQTSLLSVVVVAFMASGCAAGLKQISPATTSTEHAEISSIVTMPVVLHPSPYADGRKYVFDLLDGRGDRTLHCPASYSLQTKLLRNEPNHRPITTFSPWSDTRTQGTIVIDPVQFGAYPGTWIVYVFDCLTQSTTLAAADAR